MNMKFGNFSWRKSFDWIFFSFQLKELRQFIFILIFNQGNPPTTKTIPIPTHAPAPLLGDTRTFFSQHFVGFSKAVWGVAKGLNGLGVHCKPTRMSSRLVPDTFSGMSSLGCMRERHAITLKSNIKWSSRYTRIHHDIGRPDICVDLRVSNHVFSNPDSSKKMFGQKISET